MPTQADLPTMYSIEKIGTCVRIEGLRKSQISAVEQNQGTRFNLKQWAEQLAAESKRDPPDRFEPRGFGGFLRDAALV